jgi:2,4-diketo-3-deoxy-L-fuconate hydrolase
MPYFEQWEAAFPRLQALADAIAGGAHAAHALTGAIEFETPLMYPNKLLAVGANYASHLKEMGLQAQKWPLMPFFLRPPTTSLVGPGETVRIPPSTKQFDWELELAVCVGKTLRDATVAEAAGAVAGYTIGLDLSCRDLIPTGDDLKIDLMRGKAQDTMAPCGPYIVPAAFVRDPYNLRLQLFVNDRQMMEANTSEMLYHIDEQLSIISSYITLEPGDLLFTGSPAGSAASHGVPFLQPGDRIRAEIEAVGTLEVTMQR